MNDKRCGQHNTTAHPVQTTVVGATGGTPVPNDRNVAAGPSTCRDIIMPRPDGSWEDLPHHSANIELNAFVVVPNQVHGIIVMVGAGLKPAPTHGTEPWRESEIECARLIYSGSRTQTRI